MDRRGPPGRSTPAIFDFLPRIRAASLTIGFETEFPGILEAGFLAKIKGAWGHDYDSELLDLARRTILDTGRCTGCGGARVKPRWAQEFEYGSIDWQSSYRQTVWIRDRCSKCGDATRPLDLEPLNECRVCFNEGLVPLWVGCFLDTGKPTSPSPELEDWLKWCSLPCGFCGGWGRLTEPVHLATSTELRRNVFRTGMGSWEIIYRGDPMLPQLPFSKCKGLYLIHELLAHPNEAIDIRDLETAYSGVGDVHGEKVTNPAVGSTQAPDSQDTNVRAKGDPAAGAALQQGIENAESEMADVKYSDPERYHELVDDVAALQKQLDQDYYRDNGGKLHSRLEADPGLEQLRKTMRERFQRAFGIIGRYDPELATHLKDSIRFEKGAYSYKPVDAIVWMT